jgi:hypothetical protein
MLLDALRRVCWPALEECYVRWGHHAGLEEAGLLLELPSSVQAGAFTGNQIRHVMSS